MTAFTEAAGLPGGVRWGANVRGYLQLATYVYKVCRDPVVKGGSAMVAPVPHPTIARDYCLAPARGIDAPQQGTSSKYGRLFPGVAPFTADEEFLIHLGGSEGPCDGGLFGDGPVGNPFLYDRGDPAKLLIGSNDQGAPGDLPRNAQGMALIGDPRNDVHLFVSQLHLAMLKVHNLLVDRLREDGELEVFDAARRAITWHYQWIIVNDFLPKLVGQTLMDELLAEGPRYYKPEGPSYIPLEFADAAYRYGHSQIRRSYRLQADGPELPVFPDLLGFQPVPANRRVDWSQLFAFPGRPAPQLSKKIDGRLARSLIELPAAITGTVEVEAYHSLAVRDLQRGQAYGLPSGEALSHGLGIEPLGTDDIGLRAWGWRGETPLWYYLLKEAEVRSGGDQLGPLGGRIVAEVLLGIIDRDPESYRAVQPDWRPTLPATRPGSFDMADLLAAAESNDASPR